MVPILDDRIALTGPVHVIVSRSGRSDTVALEDELVTGTIACGHTAVVTPHLYHLPEDSAAWAELASLSGPIVVVGWLHPRPLEWLLRKHGVGSAGLHAVSLIGGASKETLLSALAWGGPAGQAGTVREICLPVPERWYPVQDGSRCTHCGHCYQFCLFGVYELDASGCVRVAHPDRCKAGCPACARICEHSAIMFPLYEKDPAICGAPGHLVIVDEEAARMFRQRVNRSAPEPPPQVVAELDDLIAQLVNQSRGGRA